jgi:hypothetical protein
MAEGNRYETPGSAVSELPIAHSGSPSVIESGGGPGDPAPTSVLDSARRVAETTRAAGCYVLPLDPEKLPTLNPRLTLKD